MMNTAIGTWNGGSSALDNKHWPAEFFIDYVRVWQKKVRFLSIASWSHVWRTHMLEYPGLAHHSTGVVGRYSHVAARIICLTSTQHFRLVPYPVCVSGGDQRGLQSPQFPDQGLHRRECGIVWRGGFPSW